MKLLLIILLLLPAALARANDLDAVQQQLEQSRREQAAHAAKAQTLQKEIDSTRKELVDVAAALRKNERTLGTLEERITAMSGEQQEITVRLEADYGSIGNLVLALQRLRRTPPEALIVRPGAPLQTAQTAMLLENILPAVSSRAHALGADLERLRVLGEQLAADRARAVATRKDLETRRKNMDRLLAEREKLYNTAESGRAAAARDVKRLAAEAQNLRELMERLAAEQARAARETSGGRSVASRPVDLPGLGKAQIPAEGVITVGYGEKDGIGATSEGLTIETAAGAIVVAPMGGVVRFAGTFKNYGNMVIIEHKNSYHSLIGGLDRIHTREGDKVNAGEPVGVLPASSSRGGKPALYYELRQKGRPVDPSSTFSGLKS